VDCSCSSAGGRVINPLQHLGRQVGGGLCVSLEVVYSATLSHHPRNDVVASQPEARGGCHSVAVSPSLCFSPMGLLM
jgi:hypothetical protein